MALLFIGLQSTAYAAPVNKVLLVDDDESDNNNIAGNRNLSASDNFYRKLLQSQSLDFDTFVVGRYANGPGFDQLRGYSLIVWYTGASYGGNRDNTSVISLKDEETLRRYLAETGGSVIVISPGYLNNALGAGGAALWAKKDYAFLQEVLGLRGGRGLLQRSTDGKVVSTDGTSYSVSKSKSPETQFSALNPAGAKVVFNSVLDPDGSGARSVAVATSQTVGQGHMVYVGFTFENITGDTGAAFGQLIQAANVQPAASKSSTQPAAAVPSSYPMRIRTELLTVTGIGRLTEGKPFEPMHIRTETMTVTGTGRLTEGKPFEPMRIRTETMTVTGTGSIH